MSENHLIANGDIRVSRCRYGLMLYSLKDNFIGRSLALYGEYSEHEVAAFKSVLRPGDVVIDGGANIGAHSLFFGRALGPGGAVYAFEPQRLVHQMLCANMALNGLANVRALQAGLGAEPGTLKVPPVNYEEAGNFGGVALGDDEAGESVRIMTIDELELPRCNLIKLDIQGMEGAAIAGAGQTIERCRPVLYVENDVQESSPDLIRQLLDFGYRLFWHLPPLYNADNFYGNNENAFSYLKDGGMVERWSINMLCLPAEDQRPCALRPITSPEDWWR